MSENSSAKNGEAKYQLLLCTCPDLTTAELIAQQLVEQRMAACVSISSPFTSWYCWQNKLERANEYLLLIKTLLVKYSKVENLICKLHPYQVPEIIAVPIEKGLTSYFAWITENVKAGED